VYSILVVLNYGTYCSTGAPESFPPPEFHGKLQVRPCVDIWSFGCVLSEVATWLVYGTTGPEHYRTLRTKSHNVNFRDSDSFHDGLNVLACVPAHHESLREALQRKGDTITQSILNLIDSSMLTPRDQRRDARDLWMMTFGHGSIFEPTSNTNDIPPSEPTTNINDILPFELPEESTNPLVIDTKHKFLLEPRKKSSSSAVSASMHESLQQAPTNSTTNLVERHNDGSSTGDGHGIDIASEQYLVNIPTSPSYQSIRNIPRISDSSPRENSPTNPDTVGQQSPSRVQQESSSHPLLPEWPVSLLHEWRQRRDSLPEGSLTHDLKDRDYVSLHIVSLATWLTLYSCSL
jgi:hypothetical protein